MSKKNRVTSEQMAAMLNQPHFNNTKQAAPLNTDPITTMPMVLEVMQVKQYDKNPRKAPNSEYDNLYESIKVNGLDQAITISKRPGDSKYMVYAGGNTRLQIIQDLWQKTQDPKYKTAHFVFKPWEKEEDTLLAHLRENDQRGELNFIDRANALLELRTLLLEEGAVTSDSKFAEYVKEAGYSVNRTDLSTYWFAAEELYEWLPSLLNNGMGRRKIRVVYDYKQAFLAASQYLDVQDKEEAELYFYSEVEKLDKDDSNTFDEKKLWGDLINALCFVTEKSLAICGIVLTKALQDKNSLKLSLEELTQPSRPAEPVEPVVAEEETHPPKPETSIEAVEASDAELDQDVTETEFSDVEGDAAFEASSSTLVTNAPNYSDAEVELASKDEETEELTSGVALALENNPIDHQAVVHSGYSFAVAEMMGLPLPQIPKDVDGLRNNACELARQLLEKSGLNRLLVHQIPDGAGFLLLPITPKSINETLEPNMQSKRWMFALHTWLELTDFSGQFAFGSQAHKYIPEDFREFYPAFTKAMVEAETSTHYFTDYTLDDWAELQEERVPYLSGFLGREKRVSSFLGMPDLLSRQTLASYYQLIEVYRALNTLLKGNLWGGASDV